MSRISFLPSFLKFDPFSCKSYDPAIDKDIAAFLSQAEAGSYHDQLLVGQVDKLD